MSKAMVVIDMQNDFIDGSLGTKEAQAIVPNVAEEIKKRAGEGYKFYVTLDTHGQDYMERLEGEKLPVVHCVKGTHGWELAGPVKEALEAAPDVQYFEKPTFGSLELARALQKENPEEIEMVGLCTDICVATNALVLRTFLPNTPISVKADCCAGVTPEKHKAALETLESCQIDII